MLVLKAFFTFCTMSLKVQLTVTKAFKTNGVVQAPSPQPGI